MRKTRKGVFETNSSSSHSITISDAGGLTDKILPQADGKVHIFPGEFGWGVDVFTDAITKASYCYTWAAFQATACEEKAYGNMLREALKEVLGCDIVFEKNPDSDGDIFCYDNEEYGDIDHQSIDVAAKAFEDKETLKNFIFNKKSELVVDNDNH